ncbi:hypothetical protein [Kriegella aquimaris]|uniref:hypothetical protein n=1 Tax=Kriegella aquimaris TaxID=192904 RepID=UPI000B7D9F17|nr:hypothetical protein [Kriegella aquimaris]
MAKDSNKKLDLTYVRNLFYLIPTCLDTLKSEQFTVQVGDDMIWERHQEKDHRSKTNKSNNPILS